jgi:hypothetical protein
MLKYFNVSLTATVSFLLCLGTFHSEAAWFSSKKSEAEKKQEERFKDENVVFNPPKGWRLADPTSLPKSVKVMVVGKSKNDYPPSINLATEKFQGTLADYLKIVKNINDSQGAIWKDLGKILTEAGPASLSQLDLKTKWGDVKMMHVILIKNKVAYILTASALKDEFSENYKQFFKAMRSLRFNKDPVAMVRVKEQREYLEDRIDSLESSFKELVVENPSLSKEQIFESQEFKLKYWEPFRSMLNRDYGYMEPRWQPLLLSKIQIGMINHEIE